MCFGPEIEIKKFRDHEYVTVEVKFLESRLQMLIFHEYEACILIFLINS